MIHWSIRSNSPWRGLCDETARLVEELSDASGIPVLVWDGSAPFPSSIPGAAGAVQTVLLGEGPFPGFPRAAALHVFDILPRDFAAVLVALERGFGVVPSVFRPREQERAGGIPGGDGPAADEAPEDLLSHRSQAPSVSPREQEVLDLVARGLPNKAIAARMGIGLGTVKFHLANLMQKFGVQNRAELVLACAREGYLEV